MMRLDFSPDEIDRLNRLREHHPDHRVRRRMQVLYLRSQGLTLDAIAQVTDLCKNTIRSYIRQYFHGGIDALMELNYYQPQSDLEDFADLIKAHFEKHPPSTIPHARAEIKRLTGLDRSDTQIRIFLIKLGFKRLKAGYVPIKGDPEAQQKFLDEELDPVLKEAQEGKSAVFF